MLLALSILPVVILIVLMTLPVGRSRWVRLPLPAHVALPAVAVLAYGLQLFCFRPGSTAATEAASSESLWTNRFVHAGAINGVLSALTPLAIVFGAVLLFKTMEKSGAMAALTARLRTLSPDPVALLVLVGWAFSFLIEGLSGFGTPAALAAPILVGLGFPAVRVAAMCLIMNSVPVSFGAVGTPVWFGLGELGLTSEQLHAVGFKAAAINASAALVIPLLALRVVVPWSEIRPRLSFVVLVVAATVLPYVVAARFSVEFPSIIGGLTGLLVGSVAARWGVGLPDDVVSATSGSPQDAPARLGLFRAALPLLAVVVILAVTRIGGLGIKALLTSEAGAASVAIGPVAGSGLGEAWISPALVVGLKNILGTGTSWKMPLLYVPFILPFVVVSLLAVPVLRMPRAAVAAAWGETIQQLTRPAIALVGALVLVKMMMLGGASSPAMLMGHAMADAAGSAWPLFAPLLGALGSFFSGSNTVSNLTFAPVQAAAAGSLSLNLTTILALQTVGGAMGNMVCIHNIVAVAAVLGLKDRGARPLPSAADERPPMAAGGVAAILRLTIGPMLVYAAIASAAAGILGIVE